MFIYLIVNHVTGRYYVGQHKGTNLRKYLQEKLHHAQKHRGSSRLFASMREHPKDAWSIHALLSDIKTKPELDAYERDFIAAYLELAEEKRLKHRANYENRVAYLSVLAKECPSDRAPNEETVNLDRMELPNG